MKELLLGNEAVARGRMKQAKSPRLSRNPSTEITENIAKYDEISEWSE